LKNFSNNEFRKSSPDIRLERLSEHRLSGSPAGKDGSRSRLGFQVQFQLAVNLLKFLAMTLVSNFGLPIHSVPLAMEERVPRGENVGAEDADGVKKPVDKGSALIDEREWQGQGNWSGHR